MRIITVASVASISIFFAFPRKVTHLITFVALLAIASEVTSTAATISAIAFARVAISKQTNEKKNTNFIWCTLKTAEINNQKWIETKMNISENEIQNEWDEINWKIQIDLIIMWAMNKRLT